MKNYVCVNQMLAAVLLSQPQSSEARALIRRREREPCGLRLIDFHQQAEPSLQPTGFSNLQLEVSTETQKGSFALHFFSFERIVEGVK